MSDSSQDSRISSCYNDWSGTYDTVPNQTRELAATVLRQFELTLAERDVVEIGCGTGHNTMWLAQRARSVVALDFSAGMLARARARLGEDQRVRLIPHDVHEPWPLADGAADLIVAMLILEHVERLDTVFAEAVRVLRPAGELFICELHPMRQLLGGQAQFDNTKTKERELIPAFLHNVADFVNGGLEAGLRLTRLDEWRDHGGDANGIPRLLTLLFTKK